MSFAEEVRDVAAQYPDSRSAVLPALRLAQERHEGWLPDEAFEEVGDALGLTPGYCKAVASFYDMLHLAPVGRHLVEVCTNICCGLGGVQLLLDAFSEQLDVRPGETTDDGQITLRAVECLGACAWPGVVAVDNRYRLSVTPEEVPGIIEELRGA
ncbi:MAG: NAD(P)H-dependent oxidoreductase subunit E [Gaiellaceae bacterium]